VDVHSQRHIVRAERSQALDDLPVNLYSNQPLTVAVKTTRRTSLAHETAFKRAGRIGRELEKGTPQRCNQCPLECDSASHSDGCEQYP